MPYRYLQIYIHNRYLQMFWGKYKGSASGHTTLFDHDSAQCTVAIYVPVSFQDKDNVLMIFEHPPASIVTDIY